MTKKRKTSKNTLHWRSWGMVMIGIGMVIIGIAAAVWLLRPDTQQALASANTISAVPAAVEFAAPVLNLQDLDGQAVSLDELRVKVVLINNWATWCPPCKAEMPTLQAFYESHREQDFVLVAIDAGDPLQSVKDFASQYKLTFPIWLDPDMDALAAFHNDGLPSSYVVDREGMVRYAWMGAIDRDTLEKYITPMLEE